MPFIENLWNIMIVLKALCISLLLTTSYELGYCHHIRRGKAIVINLQEL